MSDKSFGDHMSRGIVKNPLLSTAVTGLSIEDLTHNAVLLPVSRTSELFGRQEPEPATLAHDTPTPSGDATFTPIHPPTEHAKDDFDVNEYFARLQGTRYVSAPINSHIEDSNANLDKEENLEEINLNEPEDVQPNVHTGITADIAQNFSQLPTVLPQVASAVFSSFSSMLSMKREYTEVKRETQDVPVMGVNERAVPLMGEREVAPPPREPPVSGPGNFRLTAKKKYAQIPGLSSGESAQMPTYTPPTFNQPIFTPQQESYNSYTNVETNIPTANVGQTNVNFNAFDNNTPSIPINSQDNQTNVFQADQDNQTNIFEIKQDANYVGTAQTPLETSAQAIIPPPPMFSNLAKRDSLPNVGKTILPPSVARRIGSNKPTISNQAPTFAAVSNIFVPPPVDQSFTTTNVSQPVPAYQSNFTTSYTSEPAQSLPMPMSPTNTVSSAVFPSETTPNVMPSSTSQIGSPIAMTIGNTSVVSPFTTGNLPPPPKNAFTTPPATSQRSFSSKTAESTPTSAPQQSSLLENTQAVASPSTFTGSSMIQNIPPSLNSLSTNVPLQPTTSNSALQPMKYEAAVAPNTQALTHIPLFKNVSSVPMTSMSASPLMLPVNPMAVNVPPDTNIPLFTNVPTTSTSIINAPPQRNPYLQDQPTPGIQPECSAQISSEPTSHQITEPPKKPTHISLLSQNLSEEQFGEIAGIPAAEPTKILEPPKASGNTNFRMTKKRPQYYSGPIDGVGAISNNVKPTLTPVAPAAFQGAVFTPEAVTGYQSAVLTPENITENVSPHGAILTSENITEHQKQYSMFTPLGIDINTPVSQYASDSAGATYNTSFDLSRQVTDSYEPPKQESAVGIIGSLKSKLSSIDINKLQNSVTTFFDPGYNIPTETAEKNQPSNQQNQEIEIFLPNPETHPQPYNYDAHQTSFTYGQGSVPNASDYYNQQAHNMYSNNSYYSQPSYGTQSYSFTEIPVQQHVNQYSNVSHYPAPTVDTESSQIAYVIPCEPNSTGDSKDDAVKNKTDNLEVSHAFNESFGTVSMDSAKAYSVPLPQVDLETNEPETIKTQEENITDAMKNIKIKDDANTNVQYPTLTDEQIAINYISSPYANELGEFPETMFRGTGFVDMLDCTKKDEELAEEHKAQIDRIYSAPLQELSSMIADRSKEIFEGVSDGCTSWSNEEEVDDQSAAERLNALASDSEDEERQNEQLDLNTCEDFREINQPEQNDLTHQLIKNIIAPIQLSNPVEVPLTETHSTAPDDFDMINQRAEILLIADETIETLQIQSATELLNDNEDRNTEASYGWRNEAPLPLGQDLLDHDYSFKPNPNAIGFLGNNNLFFDKLPDYSSGNKTELNLPQDEKPTVLHRELSIPTAPPAEDLDDAKSDETGVLDVQSIEQDASKDFPVFEEYVIEPSEIDDEKIETKIDEVYDVKDKNYEVKDTFTNRVDRFKKLEVNEDAAEQKDSDVSNPNIMPSYFDTGNYAAEAHFKKSLTSPTIARIPPGFEDYDLMSKDIDKHYEPIKVPDTSTQTHLTTSISVAHTKTENQTSTVFSSMPAFTDAPARVQEQQREEKLPDFASVFGAKIELNDISADDKNTEVPTKDLPVNHRDKIEEVHENKITLPDPINFFGATQEPNTTEGVNRLASYFSTPSKNDNTKSFFELSQGQDHYRQGDNININQNKTLLESSQSQDISNIPHDTYIASINLMKDLTSIQNIEPTKEQIVRTVNYFTVEYDNDNLNFHKGDPSLNFKERDTLNKSEIEKEENIPNDTDLTDVVNKCKYCRDLIIDPVFTIREAFDFGRVKFRQAMNAVETSSPKEVNAEAGRDSERSVSVKMEDIASDGDNSEGVAMLTENRSSNEYEPVKHHWFYRVDCEEKSTWRGFSNSDSRAIENAFHSPTLNEGTLVPTDGGRYDVNVVGRLRIAVYWTDKPTNVRRCSWFYKGTTDARYVPYTEAVAEKLEVEYRHGITTGEWHRRLVLPNNELVVMHGPAVMVHFLQGGATDAFSAPNLFTFGKRVYRNPPKFKVPPDLPARVDHLLLLVHGAGEWKHQRDKIQSTMRPRVVRRGIDESEIEDTEPSSIDHLLLLCHGVGSACDMRFRAVEEVVDDFRATSLQLLQSHYRNSCDNGVVGRVEVLPISWHASLHSGPKGVDRRLARVTLASIPRLRSFTNDTVLDVLFYTSPHYCQMILDTVCGELNRIYTLFVSRNPDFKGQVSLGGHSLGSVILYDLLCNQPIPRNPVKMGSEKTYISGTAANNPTMQYPTLCFEPLALYALGSPIAIFECIRGVESLGSEFCLPTCRNFFNIFHPYDPIAYRIEPLVNPDLQNVKPSLIPHHKGRKRMHLELKDTMARVGADLKQKLIESIRSTWTSMWPSAAPPDHQLEKVVEEEIEKEQLEEDSAKEEPIQADVTPGEMLGRLNDGRRVDYVLQEAPFEMINEYLFAMSSHVCYWESEDVMLLMLREIYDSMGVQPDVTVPQQSLTVHRTTVVAASERIVTNASDASTSRL